MLIDVLTRLSADTGLDLEQKRTSLLTYANLAAKELHKRLETTSIFREVTLAVMPNKVVSLPAFVGELRGTRMHTNELPFDVHSIGQPRYVSNTLYYKYKNWRDLGFSPVHTYPEATGPLTLAVHAVETPNIVVDILGETAYSDETEESVTLTGVNVVTTGAFTPAIKSISCKTAREYNIDVYDSGANLVATLLNSQRQTRYKIIDVSQVFWTVDTSDGESLIDVLYKLPIVEFSRDTDSFYAGDEFDEAWYDMALYLYLKPIENRASDAAAHLGAALSVVQAAKDSMESGIVKKIQFGRNKFYNLFKKYRYYPGSVTNVDHNVQS